MESKIEHSKELIEYAVNTYNRIAVACSFGKDSMVTVHLAREVDPEIKIFSVMTMYKPGETFEYLKLMNKKMDLNVTVYMVSQWVPEALQDEDLKVILLPPDNFYRTARKIEMKTGKPVYKADPDQCCRLLKVEPIRLAVSGLDAWICGLRNTEGMSRKDFQEVEDKGGLIKINPILTFTEADVWRYMATRGILPHPLYAKGYRSLGCEPCSHPGGKFEREGRWKNTSKCGGECGIHSQRLK
ncbi:MAG: phosphoadenosine phosphosulfate reductase family protein [Fidelibacterota bacterium]